MLTVPHYVRMLTFVSTLLYKRVLILANFSKFVINTKLSTR